MTSDLEEVLGVWLCQKVQAPPTLPSACTGMAGLPEGLSISTSLLHSGNCLVPLVFSISHDQTFECVYTLKGAAENG